MHFIYLLLPLLASVSVAEDAQTANKGSLVVASVSQKTEIANTKTTSLNTIRVTFGKPSFSTTSTFTPITTTTAASSDISEDSNDMELLKLALTMPPEDSFYNAHFTLGEVNGTANVVDLRLDLVQPDMWVMDGAKYFDCSTINLWYSSEEEKVSGTEFPSSLTENPFYQATICAGGGLYTNPTALAASNIPATESYAIPYVNVLRAVGDFVETNLSFSLTNQESIKFEDFTFLNVFDTNVFYGGIGLAGNPSGSGLLNSLVEKGYIKSRGYSLWFNDYTDSERAVGELIPGVVDQKYFQDSLYAFEMLPIEGERYDGLLSSINSGIKDLKLPTLLLDDLSVGNDLTGQKMSLKPDSAPLPVILDSRNVNNYLPLEVIVNIAIQTNAFYSSEAGRWLVECDKIADSSASFYFQFNDLSVKIPITHFITEAVWFKNTLKFQNGKKACYLDFSPSDTHGFNSLGLSFLSSVYVAVDNDGGYVALANSNSLLEVEVDDLVQSFTSTRLYSQIALQSNVSIIHSSIGFIESGTIPFATTVTRSGTAIAFSLSVPTTNSQEQLIPARFSGAIANGETVITGTKGTTTTFLPGLSASAATNSDTKYAGAQQLHNPMAVFVTRYSTDFYGVSAVMTLFLGLVYYL